MALHTVIAAPTAVSQKVRVGDEVSTYTNVHVGRKRAVPGASRLPGHDELDVRVALGET